MAEVEYTCCRKTTVTVPSLVAKQNLQEAVAATHKTVVTKLVRTNLPLPCRTFDSRGQLLLLASLLDATQT